jgi:acyl carrier protein
MMGNIGQTNYSTANAYLDNLILDRNNRGLCGLSIQWSAWQTNSHSGGMANSDVLDNLKEMGLISITEQMGEGFLNNIINKRGIHSCMPVIKKEYKKPNSEIQTKFKTKEEINSEIKRIVQNISNNEIKEDESLMDAGIDSLSSIELRNSLQSSFNITLDNSLLFNYPTINALTKYIISKMPIESKYKITYNNIKSNIVDNLCIELENVGKIEYMGYTDIENVDIDNDIDIQQQNFKLNTYYYKNTKINKICVITLYNFIEPEEDKETGDIIRQNLSDQLFSINKTLLEYEPLNGRIKYFVNYL